MSFKYNKHVHKQWQDTEENQRDQRGDSWERCQSAEEAADDSEILNGNTDRRHVSNGVIDYFRLGVVMTFERPPPPTEWASIWIPCHVTNSTKAKTKSLKTEASFGGNTNLDHVFKTMGCSSTLFQNTYGRWEVTWGHVSHAHDLTTF